MEVLLGFNCFYMDFNSISIGFNQSQFIFKWIYIRFSVKLKTGLFNLIGGGGDAGDVIWY